MLHREMNFKISNFEQVHEPGSGLDCLGLTPRHSMGRAHPNRNTAPNAGAAPRSTRAHVQDNRGGLSDNAYETGIRLGRRPDVERFRGSQSAAPGFRSISELS